MTKSSLKKIVVVGSGHGGVELAAALRHRNFDGAITIVGDEPDLPYQRPPLSKEFLKSPDDSGLPLKGESFYPQKDIALRLGARAERIDRATQELVLSDGERLPYDHLALATGARNRTLPIPGLDAAPKLELRTLSDARRLNARLNGLGHVTVIGGGFIGLEVAALLRTRGIEVDVVEAMDRLMGRVLSTPASGWFKRFHTELGTRLHFGKQVTGIEGEDGSVSVALSDGLSIETDAILVAAGVVPNAELAADAGLEISNGVVVDETLLTSDPNISALGDAAAYPNMFAGGMARLESVQNAVDQGKAIAARLTGETTPYTAVPWFWSHQGSARLQIAGLSNGHDDAVVRGDLDGDKFSIFLYRGDVLASVESLNSAGEHMAARRIIGAGTYVPKDVAADISADLKAFLK
ncbi:MAG TPA: FAD-dependent oxidoreductase [Rhizobiaceae bacterium]|nr:FAD-dependent oxidoreductase [Rhizobiaceae bacterium]